MACVHVCTITDLHVCKRVGDVWSRWMKSHCVYQGKCECMMTQVCACISKVCECMREFCGCISRVCTNRVCMDGMRA